MTRGCLSSLMGTWMLTVSLTLWSIICHTGAYPLVIMTIWSFVGLYTILAKIPSHSLIFSGIIMSLLDSLLRHIPYMSGSSGICCFV